MAYRVLADSNLDWGQAGWYLERYLQAHPEAKLNPTGPVTGTVVVEVNDLVGITKDADFYRWLREGYRPVGTIAYAYLIFNLPPP
jgi:hypothetical protein